MMTSTRLIARLSSLLIVCALVGGLWAQTVPQLPDPGNTAVSREQQIQLGFQTAAEVYKQMPVLPDSSPETQYIQQLGKKLVATIPQEYSWPFEFHVIAQKEINAFALPGGPMFVNVGTITSASNEAQLAGVMAHEMAHVYMQHSAKQMQKASLTQGLAGLAGAILGGHGALGNLAQMGIQIGAGTLMLKYSRSDESQADAVGAIIMYKAGYDPQGLADFFQKLDEEAGGSRGPQFLSSHPNPGNREQAIAKLVQSWPPKRFTTNTNAFNNVQKDAKNVKVYTAQEIEQGAKSGKWEQMNRQNGAVFKAPPGVSVQTASQSTPSQASGPVSWNDVAPSSRMVSQNLGPVSISVPDNWQVFAPQQQGQSVTIAPRAGVVSNGVGYGVVLDKVAAQPGASLDQTTSQLVRAMQSGGSDLQPIGNASRITVAGVSGRSLIMESTSPFPDGNGQSQRERDWLVTVPKQDGSVMYFVFVAPKSQFDRLKPTFDKMLKSVRL